jgi:hypothetical protein
MVGKIRGRINDDRVSGTATTIEIENEVRGRAANVDGSANPRTFTVNNQRVYVDSQTVYANLPQGFGSIENGASLGGGTYIEVHGFRDSAGAIRATRVEARNAVAGDDEIRGGVEAGSVNTTAKTFTLRSGPVNSPGGVIVNYSGATFTTGSESQLAGAYVEVHGAYDALSQAFTATRIDFEDLEDSAFVPASSENAEVEGIISGFTASSAEFRVATRRVLLGGSVRFEGGTVEDLANDARIEAEGNLNASGVLVANKIQFKSARLILQSTASAVTVGTPANPGQFTVLGTTVVVTSVTRIDTSTASLGDVASGDCVEVRAHLDGTTLVADEVKELSASACDRWIVRGPVAGQDSAAGTVTLIAASGANSTVVNVNGAQFRDAADSAITRAAFFTAARIGSIVKTRGTNPATSPLVATEAELEN